MNESGTGAGAAGAGATEGAVGAPATTSGIEADVVDTVPKTMQGKARRLMEHLKRDLVVDLVNDLLRKRKTDPTGWQPFARQLRAMNLPMELVGNVTRRAYIRQATTPTPTTSTPGAVVECRLPLALVVVAHEDRSVGHPSLVDAVRWNIPCSPHLQNVNVRLWRHWLVGKTFKTMRHVSIAQCALRCRAIHRTRPTVASSLHHFALDFT